MGMVSTTAGGSLVTVSGTLGGAVTSGIVTKGCVFFICTGVVAFTSGPGAGPIRAVSFLNSGPAVGSVPSGWVAVGRGGGEGGGAAAGDGDGGAGLTGGRTGKLIRTGSFFGSFASAMGGLKECAKIGALSLVYFISAKRFFSSTGCTCQLFQADWNHGVRRKGQVRRSYPRLPRIVQ
jgi:hypothetical protein